jgi:hypothetical protein
VPMHVSRPWRHWYPSLMWRLAVSETSCKRWEISVDLRGYATCRWPGGTKRLSCASMPFDHGFSVHFKQAEALFFFG